MNINIPVEDSKRPLDCPLCGGSPEIRVSKTAYSGNNRMDYFVVSCSNGHGPAEEGVSQEFMLKRWDAWAARITSILSSPIHPCPTCGRMPHVKANDLGLKLDCECRASSNPVSDPVAAIELWERNIEKKTASQCRCRVSERDHRPVIGVGCNGSGGSSISSVRFRSSYRSSRPISCRQRGIRIALYPLAGHRFSPETRPT